MPKAKAVPGQVSSPQVGSPVSPSTKLPRAAGTPQPGRAESRSGIWRCPPLGLRPGLPRKKGS